MTDVLLAVVTAGTMFVHAVIVARALATVAFHTLENSIHHFVAGIEYPSLFTENLCHVISVLRP